MKSLLIIAALAVACAIGIATTCASSFHPNLVPAQGEMKEQSFSAPRLWAQEFTTQQGWGIDYPRTLADINGDKRQDVVGFGNDGVWLGTSNGTGFSPAF